MNANFDLLTTAIATETAFDPRAARAISRAAEDNELERLKARLLRQTLNEAGDAAAAGYIRCAANEAAALAWATHFPLLVFPALFEEKASEAFARMCLQASIRRRSRRFISACRRHSCLIHARDNWSDLKRS